MGVSALTLTACGTVETRTEPDAPAVTPASATTPPAASEPAVLGDAITLQGQQNTTRVQVRPVKLIDPAPTGEYDQPPPKHRRVAVRLTLRNQGDSTFSDFLNNGTTLVLDNDEPARPVIVTDPQCPELGVGVALAPHARRVGCLYFDVPRARRPKTLQIILDSGYAPMSGEWDLS